MGRSLWRRVECAANHERPCRRTYELVCPVTVAGVGEVRYVAADFAVTPDHGPETMLFKCNEDGVVTDWSYLWCVYHDAVSDDSAIEDFLLFYGDDETYGPLRGVVAGGDAR